MQSLLDQVNILIKMKVGDPYRLEHIKLMLKQKRTVYGSDRAYLDHLIHDYIEQVKTQKKLSKIKNLQHGFFNSVGGKSKNIYKSLNCGPG